MPRSPIVDQPSAMIFLANACSASQPRWKETMHGYHLQDEFIDPAAEQALIAAVIHKPTLYFEFLDILVPDVFATEDATWREVALAIEAEQPQRLSSTWRPQPEHQST